MAPKRKKVEVEEEDEEVEEEDEEEEEEELAFSRNYFLAKEVGSASGKRSAARKVSEINLVDEQWCRSGLGPAVDGGDQISNLHYADDTIIFYKADPNMIQTVKWTFIAFETLTGLGPAAIKTQVLALLETAPNLRRTEGLPYRLWGATGTNEGEQNFSTDGMLHIVPLLERGDTTATMPMTAESTMEGKWLTSGPQDGKVC